MMELGCNCGDLPTHDHLMGHCLDENGVMGPWWDMNEVGRLWVNWKAVARALTTDAEGNAGNGSRWGDLCAGSDGGICPACRPWPTGEASRG